MDYHRHVYGISYILRSVIQNVQGLGRNQVLVTSVADGDKGTRQTIQYARQLIAEGLRDPNVHELALSFCKAYEAQPYDEKAELEAVFDGVLDNFDYRKHVVGAQSLQPVSGMLRTLSGDCAELNLILLPSLLGTIGYSTRAVAIKADPGRPAEFSHVYIEALTTDGEWIAMDAARENTEFGIEPQYYWGREEFDLTPADGGHMNGYASRSPRGIGSNVVVIAKPKNFFPRRGLGDATQDLTDALAAAPSILTGVAQVVKAEDTPGVAYSGVGFPAGYSASSTGVGTGLSATVGGSSSMLLLVMVVLGIAAFSGKGGR